MFLAIILEARRPLEVCPTDTSASVFSRLSVSQTPSEMRMCARVILRKFEFKDIAQELG